MKKLLFIAAAIIAGATAMAQTKVDDAVKLNAETYSFGKIKQGTPVTTVFEITNTSDKPLVIESAVAGCGCTTPEYAKEPIAPNSVSKLKVGYNAVAMGQFNKDVTVKFAGIPDPKVLRITGEVLDEAAYQAYTKSAEYKADQAKKAKTVKGTKK